MAALDPSTIDPARLNGQPCIHDPRITVRRLLKALVLYEDRASLRREYPEIGDEDVRQALGYAGVAARRRPGYDPHW